MAARTRIGVLLLCSLLGACFGGKSESYAEEVGGHIPLSPPPLPLIQLAAAAPTATPYEGTRRYEAYWEIDGFSHMLIYREEIKADGTGQFSIDPLEVLQPNMSPSEEQVFMLLQDLRQGFMFKHRDFAIRDVKRFLNTWQVIDLGTTTQVLGRTCAQWEVRRIKGADRVYALDVDVQNGIILRSEERDLSGAVLSMLEYDSLNLTPDFTLETFHEELGTQVQFGNGSPLPTQLKFVPAKPKLLPDGYRLQDSVAIFGTGDPWVRYTYGDGAEEIFWLHSGEAEVLYPGPLGTPNSGSPGQAGQGQGSKPKDVVKWLPVGPWTVVWGDIGEDSFIVMGKVPREELYDLIESAFY
jgi:hypothetical protein